MSTPISSTGGSSTSGAAAGSALITSTGIGSGLNINAIVSDLTTAFGAAQTNQLTNEQNSLNTQVSAFGTFSSALSTLQSTLSTLENPDTLAGFDATVSDKSIASASTSSGAVAGQYSLEVQNLATSATLTSQPIASSTSVVGTGTLSISVGSASTSIDITSADDTLSGIANAINSAPNNPGVTASIISTTSGARLVLAGTATGADNSITVAETDGGSGLSSLVYDPAGGVTNLTQTQAAQDASYSINGFGATSSSNVVSNAISGVTLNLLQASAANTPTTLTISPDNAAAQTSIGTFVTALNGVLSSVQSLTGFNATTNVAGPLSGNATLEAFQNQLENILDAVNPSNPGGVTSLADIGITADADGSFDTNTTTLGNALSANLTAVGNLLGGTNGIATQINNLINSYTGTGGLLDNVNQGLQSSLSNVSRQQSALSAELATYSATLTAQYNAADTAIAALKESQTFLTAEFDPTASAASGSSSSNSSLSSGTLGV
jgi:flagellar hook-associated protein 2